MTTSAPDVTDRSAPADVGRTSSLLATASTLVGPLVVLYAATALASGISSSVSVSAQYALANLVIVVGMQIFVGTSGVLSFGHVAFVAIGAWVYGLATIDVELKRTLMPDLFPVLARLQLSPVTATALGGLAAMILAIVVGPLLMRLHGLQAGIATFALLGATVQVLTYWTEIGPPSGQSMVGVRQDWDIRTSLYVGLGTVVLAWLYQRSRTARLLRASRENIIAAPGVGVAVTRHRVIAFVWSAGICAVGGALWAETNGVVQASQLSVGFTFTVIAMLVLGGTTSVWGSVVGVLFYSALDIVLVDLQGGITVAGLIVTVPDGARPLILGAILILVLLLRPLGVTGGREFGWAFRLPRRRTAQVVASDSCRDGSPRSGE